jgi:hypothetical protein
MSFDLIEIILMGILVALILSFLLLSVILKAKNIKLYSVIAQLVVDKQIMSDEISKLSFMANNAPAIENDFVKFLSDSRASAYEYIEDVQAALLEFKKKVEPQILYAKASGATVSQSSYTIFIDKISDAYDDLTKVMPKDSSGEVLK